MGGPAPSLSAVQCVYKSCLAPLNLAHEPTPKKSGEFEDRFFLPMTKRWSECLCVCEVLKRETVCRCMLPSLESFIYHLCLYSGKTSCLGEMTIF